MLFDVFYFITAFELVLYGYMVANREWLFSSYRRSLMDEAYAVGGDYGSVSAAILVGSGAAGFDYDYSGFEVEA